MFFLQLPVNYVLLRSPGVVCETAIGCYLHGSLRSPSLVTVSATASVAAVSYLFSPASASLIPASSAGGGETVVFLVCDFCL